MSNLTWFAVFAVTVAVVRSAPGVDIAAPGNVREKMNATADANKAADDKSKSASPQSLSYINYANAAAAAAAAYHPAQYQAQPYVANAWYNLPYQAMPYIPQQNQAYYLRNQEIMTAGQPKAAAMPYTPIQNQGYYLQNPETAGLPKTFIHKPSFYQQQPQVYALPVQPVQTVHTYPVYQPYVQHSYAHQAYSLYPEYKSVADDANDQDIRLMNGEQQIQPMVSYKTQYILEKPATDKQYAPIDGRRSVPEIVQMYPGAAAAPQSPTWTPMAYPATGYTQMEDLRKSDLLVDDKFNMRISPNYLIDRVHATSAGNAHPLFLMKSAEEPSFDEYPEFAGQPSGGAPAVDGQDRVYMEMNPYDMGPNKKSMIYQGGAVDQQQQQQQQQQQIAAIAPSKWNLRDTNKEVPYSRDEIRQQMEQYYTQIYNEQMQNLARQYPKEEQSLPKATVNYEELLDKINQLNKLAKESRARSKDDETLKEVPKDTKADEKKDAETSTKRS